MNNIFILSDKKVKDAQNLEIIKINFIKDITIDLTNCDAIIFSSKNSVKAIDKLDKNWKKKEIYSIGKATTKTIQKFHANINYEANKNYGNDFANELINKLQNKKVFYPRAKVVLSNLVNILKENKIDIKEQIIYETICNNQTKILPKNSTIIFSSPSTIECFFKNYKWDDNFEAIVIGTVTEKYLPKDININYKVSKKQTLEECVKIAKDDKK
jgi:uroporphyrinogen-III synthase